MKAPFHAEEGFRLYQTLPIGCEPLTVLTLSKNSARKWFDAFGIGRGLLADGPEAGSCFKNLKRAGFVAALAAGAMTLSTAAEAHDPYHRNSDDAAIAIGAGIIGLAIGAEIASDNHGHYHGGYYYYGAPAYYGPPRYYPGYPRGYYYNPYPRPYYRGYDRHWNHGWHRGWDRRPYRGS